MRLPIPYDLGGRIISDCEIVAPKTGLLADVASIAEDGRVYAAIAKFVEGVMRVDNEKLSPADVRLMPYRSAEMVSTMAVIKISPDDGFEGVYTCPRCGKEQIAELNGEDDSRDFISDLTIDFADEPEVISITLDDPVEFTSKGEVIETVEFFTIRHPNLDDCIRAERKVPDMLQAQIYCEALETVNGHSVEDRWRNQFGYLLFKRLGIKDSKMISQEMQKYGIPEKIQKRCPKCKKVWDAPINTSGFFESALRS